MIQYIWSYFSFVNYNLLRFIMVYPCLSDFIPVVELWWLMESDMADILFSSQSQTAELRSHTPLELRGFTPFWPMFVSANWTSEGNRTRHWVVSGFPRSLGDLTTGFTETVLQSLKGRFAGAAPIFAGKSLKSIHELVISYHIISPYSLWWL